jgi:hypothetical protein
MVIIQSRRMAEAFNWIVFQAHPSRIDDLEEEHPEYFGVFICPMARREPEQLLVEVLGNRKLFLAQVTDQRKAFAKDDWGMHERLKPEIEQQGYALAVMKVQAGAVPYD